MAEHEQSENGGQQSGLSPDKPVSTPEEDRLDYAPFARKLAESLMQMVPPEGLVAAIYGPWGSGKSTMLNLVVHCLRQQPEKVQPVVVRFNPWWFSGQEDLTRRFFDQMRAAVSIRPGVGEALATTIGSFAEVVSELPASIRWLSEIIPYMKSVKAGAQALKPKAKDVVALKSKLGEELARLDTRILVIIDDIDRLTADEVRLVFRLIKAVADLPNMVYLLAFDRGAVSRVIEDTHQGLGDAYLEKIVQVSFELPLPDPSALQSLFFSRLHPIIAATPTHLWDQTYWGNVYLEGIQPLFETPRDVVRLVNTLAVTYPAVVRKVNPVDFVAVEALRVFVPLVYDTIRRNPDQFIGTARTQDRQTEAAKNFHASWLANVADTKKDSIQQVLRRLFPRLESIWGNTYYGDDYLSLWRWSLRVCSPDVFPVYFRLTEPTGGVSHSEMLLALSKTGDATAFADLLVQLSQQRGAGGVSRASVFLDRLEDYTRDAIAPGAIPPVIQAVYQAGDAVLSAEGDQTTAFMNSIRLSRITRQLLSRLDEPQRFEVLRQAMLAGRAVSQTVSEVIIQEQEHGRHGATEPLPEGQRLISPEHLDQLRAIAVDRIRQAAADGTLAKCPQLAAVLFQWRAWAGPEEVRSWVENWISEDTGLLAFLEALAREEITQVVGDRVGVRSLRLDPQRVELYTSPSVVLQRLTELAASGKLSDRQRLLAEQYARECRIRKQGGNPNVSFQ